MEPRLTNCFQKMFRPMTDTRYHEALKRIPRPGTGCHPSLLSIANYGIMAGLNPERIFLEIRDHIPQGKRRISDREISDAVNKALSDHKKGSFVPKPRSAPIVTQGEITLKKLIGQGSYSTEVDLFESSPIRLWDAPQRDPALLLKTLYDKDDLLWVGDRHDSGVMGKTIRSVSEWINYFENGGSTYPHIILNPLSGNPAPKKTGDGETFRGDGNVSFYRYCMVEFDNLSREDQVKFWSAVRLPICALIDTGGKSIHAWLDVQKLTKVETTEQWGIQIKNRLYDRILKPLGVDGACSNPARLSRLPGHYRAEKGEYQRLLWLSPGGRPIQ